ncbi:hypothetical protein GMDG_05790 [Pseudogymnoascus destructans 20631-21]|uniref:Thioredoxin-like fold domain-containing protein n=1 Tax=Pseudogymnoascus destructans (strain ATCC MYA-4855 / 20631-21) TaxID=658429 RepID=L8FPL6_PSED2|nr:hypothetical protein GMDG_05790 [Pseudogymnoascus destructans 20631-21]
MIKVCDRHRRRRRKARLAAVFRAPNVNFPFKLKSKKCTTPHRLSQPPPQPTRGPYRNNAVITSTTVLHLLTKRRTIQLLPINRHRNRNPPHPPPHPLHHPPPPPAPSSTSSPCTPTPPTPSPLRSPSPSPLPTLHIFTSPSSPTAPSPNPTCLKHQTALRLASLPHTTTNSTNHASPTGALPFLLPPTSSPLLPAALLPVGAGQILSYATKAGHPLPARPAHPKAKVYASLIDDAIRPAWLHAVYLTPANAHLPTRLYLAPATSSWLVQTYQGISLRRAASEQLKIAAPGEWWM